MSKWLAVAACALLLVGCGGGGGDPAASGAATPPLRDDGALGSAPIRFMVWYYPNLPKCPPPLGNGGVSTCSWHPSATFSVTRSQVPGGLPVGPISARGVARVELKLGDASPQVLQPGYDGNYSVQVDLPTDYTGCGLRAYTVTVTDAAGESLTKYGTVCAWGSANTGAFSDYGTSTVTLTVAGRGNAHVEFRRWNEQAKYLDEYGTSTAGAQSWTLRANEGDELVLRAQAFDGSRQLFIESGGQVLAAKALAADSAGELRITCCSPQAGGDGPVPLPVPVRTVPLTWYAEWPVRTYEFRTQAEWSALFADVRSVGNPQPALPAVDFTRDAVLGVSLGWAADPCTTVAIDSITRQGSDYTVRYAPQVPPPNSGCVQMLAPSTSFVLVPQPVGRVTFVRQGS